MLSQKKHQIGWLSKKRQMQGAQWSPMKCRNGRKCSETIAAILQLAHFATPSPLPLLYASSEQKSQQKRRHKVAF
jgi:hypothetical protein